MLEKRALQNDFLKRFLNASIWHKIRTDFGHLFGNPVWVSVAKLNAGTRHYLKQSAKLDDECIDKTVMLFEKSKKSGHLEVDTCCENRGILSVPVLIENKIYGYLGIIHFHKNTPVSIINLLRDFVEILALKSQKDLELERLYETIGPRTLALSTIHTLHRIMSSNLNLDELLPRIARLSLQVLGANICKIYLFDKKKRILLPKVIINLKDINYKRKRRQLGKEVAKKVANSGIAVLKNDLIAVPLVEEEVLGVILIAQRSNGKPFTYFDQDILLTLSEQAVIAIKNAGLFEQQERLTLGSIRSMSSLLKMRRGEWHSHTPIFKDILLLLAQKLKLSKEEITALKNAALMHDIEKVNIPERILKKNKPLSDKDYKIIKEHPLKTVNILKPLQSLEPTIPIILHHHERYDGTGYPYGLKGRQIPIGARIMAVVDSFEAMITERPWRKALSMKQAIAEIEKNSAVQFDPLVVGAFLEVIKNPKIVRKLKKHKEKVKN